ncbi:two-component sensor histidine kinase [candidate division GN15 bacterium]|nr:two-component sensor histidine kinase [candidate division GN15 bacterium]
MASRWRWLNRTSDLYVGKSTLFKTFLLLGIGVISTVFIWYTFDVIESLQRDIRSQVDKYVQLWQLAANSPTSGSELQFIFNEIIVKATFPILVVDQSGEPLYWRNIKDIAPDDRSSETIARLKEIAIDMKEDNGEFKLHYGEDFVNYLYYGDSEVISQLKLMPFIEIGIVLAFLTVGLIGFQTIRRSEERHIWVGMAKETAHQLGTPISSLMGWLEVIDSESPRGRQPDGEASLIDQTVDNMKIDVDRLQKVANRFGMIGSVPELKPCDLNDLVAEVVEYYRRRLPFEGRGVRISLEAGEIPKVALNPELLSWALENLVKNALQAVDSKDGRIDVVTRPSVENGSVEIELTDNGKGIPSAAARKIFRPGFTTKKRGWGLGLTLVKRIVEEYHGGMIRLERSRPGETVFAITLPVAANQ